MNSVHLGEIIKEFRKERKLSQEALAEGICSRKEIIRIEKGETFPSYHTISLLSIRLGTDLYKFFEFLNYDDPIACFNLMENLKLALNNAHYQNCSDLLNEDIVSQLDNPLHMEMISWFKISCDANISKNFEDGIHDLIHILPKDILSKDYNIINHTFMNPIYYKMINSCGVMLANMNKFQEAQNLFQSTADLLLDHFQYDDPETVNIILLNLSNLLYIIKDIDNCLKYCEIALNILKKYQTFQLLGGFYSIMGNCYEYKGDLEKSKKYYAYYIYYYEMIDEPDFVAAHKKSLNQDYKNCYF